MIKVDVISGFLGAGKTTLIKKLFESKEFKNEQVVIIENEFGEIGIDGSFLKGSGVEIKEINAGCICCSLVGDFEKSIKELVSSYHPNRIIIEPSGVGKLSDIINAILKVKDEDLKINILATVVDGGKAKMYLKNFGEFFDNQVKAADTIVVGKVDKISEDKLQESVDVIKSVNEKANIITTNIASLDADKLLQFLEEKSSLREEFVHEVEEEHEHHHDDEEHCCCGHHHHDEEDDDDDDCCCGHHHEHHHDDDEEEDECCCEHHHDHHDHHDDDDEDEDECCCGHHDGEHEHHHHHHHGHDADEVFTSIGIETVKSYSRSELEAILNKLSDENSDLGMILRSKGILKASDNDKWYYFDLVAGDYEIRLGEPDYTGRFVVIGSKIDEEKINALISKKA